MHYGQKKKKKLSNTTCCVICKQITRSETHFHMLLISIRRAWQSDVLGNDMVQRRGILLREDAHLRPFWGHLMGLKYERQGVGSAYIGVNRFQAEGPASVKALWWEWAWMFKETERGAQCGWEQGPVYHHQAVSYRDLPDGPVVKTLPSNARGTQVQCLVRELISNMLNCVARKKKKG